VEEDDDPGGCGSGLRRVDIEDTTEEVLMGEPDDAGSEMLLIAGGGGGTINNEIPGEEGCPSSPCSFVVIVNGMGIKIDVLNLESSSPSVPADEDDRDTPKNSSGMFRLVKKKTHTQVLRNVKTSEDGIVQSFDLILSWVPICRYILWTPLECRGCRHG